MGRLGSFVLAITLLGGCTPKLDPAEVKEMLLDPSRGVIGGVEIGDSWEKIKADHDKRYEVRDETTKDGTFRQLRHDLRGSPGDNGFYITFGVDSAGKVDNYSVSIYGRKRNMPTVRELFHDVQAHLDGKLGPGVCGASIGGEHNTTCTWSSRPGAPQVTADFLDMSDIDSRSIEISVHPPRNAR